jgi:flagellar motility protein MotE (MotC chaperone)
MKGFDYSMEQQSTVPPDGFNYRHRFLDRQKLLVDHEHIIKLAQQIRDQLVSGQSTEVRQLIIPYYPPDLADVMEFLDDHQDKQLFDLLNPAESADVLDELDDCTKEKLVHSTEPERLVHIVEALPSDEAADILAYLHGQDLERVLDRMSPQAAQNARFLLQFSKQSAGGIMSLPGQVKGEGYEGKEYRWTFPSHFSLLTFFHVPDSSYAAFSLIHASLFLRHQCRRTWRPF